jgi:hypothetical protein
MGNSQQLMFNYRLSPIALAQRHYRTHTLRVRTLVFGLKKKIVL